MTKLVGDYNFFMTVLKHGIFDSKSRREFLQALQKERQAAMASSVDAHHAGDEGSPTKRARVENDALRQAALHARLAYRKGARLAQRMKEDNSIYASLSNQEKSADKAYGHGRDAQCFGIRERAVLRAWTTDVLSHYFNE